MRVTPENGGVFISFYTLKLTFVAMELIFWINEEGLSYFTF